MSAPPTLHYQTPKTPSEAIFTRRARHRLWACFVVVGINVLFPGHVPVDIWLFGRRIFSATLIVCLASFGVYFGIRAIHRREPRARAFILLIIHSAFLALGLWIASAFYGDIVEAYRFHGGRIFFSIVRGSLVPVQSSSTRPRVAMAAAMMPTSYNSTSGTNRNARVMRSPDGAAMTAPIKMPK
jgi:hypothetical protein